GVKIAYLAFTYILWGSFCYTAVTIPFGSMATVISPEPNDRASLSVMRSLGSTLATLFGSVLAPLLVFEKIPLADGGMKEAMIGSRVTTFAGVFSLLAILGYLVCYFLTVERIQAPQQTKGSEPSLLQTLKNSFKNRPLMALIAAIIFTLVAQLTTLNMFIYVFPDYYGNAAAQSLVNLLGLLVMVAAMGTTKPLAVRLGKAELCIYSCILSTVLYLLTWILRPASVWVFAIFQVLGHIGLGYLTATSWAMIADVIDDVEVKEGSCQVGSVFALSGFARKMGQALTTGLTGWMLGAIGYNSQAASMGQVQSQNVLDGIFNITCLVPMAAYALLGLTLWLLYPLKKKQVEENADILRERRAQ
ncbi:MAG: MFS transporter, partial [Eubacteriales bacterium]|nr:MFS transporter [Eubacteriales bacterium]